MIGTFRNEMPNLFPAPAARMQVRHVTVQLKYSSLNHLLIIWQLWGKAEPMQPKAADLQLGYSTRVGNLYDTSHLTGSIALSAPTSGPRPEQLPLLINKRCLCVGRW